MIWRWWGPTCRGTVMLVQRRIAAADYGLTLGRHAVHLREYGERVNRIGWLTAVSFAGHGLFVGSGA